jgi:hypothetical protein
MKLPRRKPTGCSAGLPNQLISLIIIAKRIQSNLHGAFYVVAKLTRFIFSKPIKGHKASS